MDVLWPVRERRKVEREPTSVVQRWASDGRAIAELEKLVQTHSGMPFVFADPRLDPLRSFSPHIILIIPK